MYKRFVKRSIDIVLSFVGLIVLALPMLVVAIMIRCDSKGSAIFKTERVGRYSKPFRFYKFRSMSKEAPKDCAPSKLDDAGKYITKIGKFIRKTSIDELPQLWCILKGDMSIIGPRPAGFSEVELNEERSRLGVDKLRPGLTGLAQVNGRDITAADIQLKVKYDAEYARDITFKKDMIIFFKTVKKVFIRDGIVEGAEAFKNNSEGQSAEITRVAVLENCVAEEVSIGQAQKEVVASYEELEEVACEIVQNRPEVFRRSEAIEILKENIEEVKSAKNNNIA